MYFYYDLYSEMLKESGAMYNILFDSGLDNCEIAVFLSKLDEIVTTGEWINAEKIRRKDGRN